ncbi:MAG TPA: hypothetical protein VHF25_03245 [Nitriliruptorales bacterium]|nr:hypothetical protein [Nitriliruptorales bacterium]
MHDVVGRFVPPQTPSISRSTLTARFAFARDHRRRLSIAAGPVSVLGPAEHLTWTCTGLPAAKPAAEQVVCSPGATCEVGQVAAAPGG